MTMISVETATDIALAYREIDTAEKLLKDVQEQIDKRHHETCDIRDAFGRRVDGLQLGVPSGGNGHRLYQVDWELAKPILQAHILKIKGHLGALNAKAIAEQTLEFSAPTTPHKENDDGKV
jgi:hypothetical protein